MPAFACWVSLWALPESPSLISAVVVSTRCSGHSAGRGRFWEQGDGFGVCNEDVQDSFPHWAGAWFSLLCLMAPHGASLVLWWCSSSDPHWGPGATEMLILKHNAKVLGDPSSGPAGKTSSCKVTGSSPLPGPRGVKLHTPKLFQCKRKATDLQDTAVPEIQISQEQNQLKLWSFPYFQSNKLCN